jgi:hypothetical protein
MSNGDFLIVKVFRPVFLVSGALRVKNCLTAAPTYENQGFVSTNYPALLYCRWFGWVLYWPSAMSESLDHRLYSLKQWTFLL